MKFITSPIRTGPFHLTEKRVKIQAISLFRHFDAYESVRQEQAASKEKALPIRNIRWVTHLAMAMCMFTCSAESEDFRRVRFVCGNFGLARAIVDEIAEINSQMQGIKDIPPILKLTEMEVLEALRWRRIALWKELDEPFLTAVDSIIESKVIPRYCGLIGELIIDNSSKQVHVLTVSFIIHKEAMTQEPVPDAKQEKGDSVAIPVRCQFPR
jgi:hypothetical protein